MEHTLCFSFFWNTIQEAYHSQNNSSAAIRTGNLLLAEIGISHPH